MIYVYAIVEAESRPPAGAVGFEGAPLRVVEGGRAAAAVVSDLEDRVEPSESTLWEHEAVVEELMAAGALLPMRFGSTLPDEDSVIALLRERGDELEEGLARVRGAVELGVRALWEAEGEEPSPVTVGAGAAATSAGVGSSGGGEVGVGTSYLLHRLGHTRRAESLAQRVHGPLESLARASTRRAAASPRALLTGAYLVDAGAVEAFRAAVERLDEEIDEAAILCTGPWPPYSFAPTGAGP